MLNAREFLNSKEKNKAERLPACWLACKNKKFVGSGTKKLSKAETEKVDVAAACDDILNCIKNSQVNDRTSFYVSSKLGLGSLRILQKQVNNLEEECEQLLRNIILGNCSPKKSRKINITEEIKEKEINWDEDIEELDIANLFKLTDQADRHLIEEVDIPSKAGELSPLTFGDENALNDIREVSAFGDLAEDIFNNIEPQEPGLNPEVVSTAESPSVRQNKITGTPKRKHLGPHDETPTKRKQFTPSTSKNPSELARSPVTPSMARRSLFRDNVETYSNIEATSANIMSRITIGFDDNTGNLGMEPPVIPVADDAAIALLTAVHPLPADATNEFADATDLLQAKVTGELQETEHIQESLEPSPENAFRLKELDMESVVSSRSGRRKGSKKKLVFDVQTQIKLKPNNIKTCTKTMEANTIKIPEKIAAADLLLLPSVGLKRNALDQRYCSWGKTLQNRFSEVLTWNHSEIESHRDQRRTVTATKRSARFGSFKNRTTPTISTPQLQPTSYTEEATENQQKLPSISCTPPASSVIEPIIESAQLRAAAEPVATADDEFIAPEPPIERKDEHRISKIRLSQESEHSTISTTSSQERERFNSLIMPKNEFYDLLEEMWALVAARSTDPVEDIKIDLNDILEPERTSAREFHIYFHYLSAFERDGKLRIQQEIPFGPVYIIKEDY